MSLRYALDDALRRDPSPGNLAAAIGRFGSVELEFYQPKGADRQSPHDRDEIYIIARGHGTLTMQEQRAQCVAGDVLCVPAHREHRFIDFSDDFAAWVIFF